MVQHYRQHQRTIKVLMGDGTEYLGPAGYITRCGRMTDQEGLRPAITPDKKRSAANYAWPACAAVPTRIIRKKPAVSCRNCRPSTDRRTDGSRFPTVGPQNPPPPGTAALPRRNGTEPLHINSQDHPDYTIPLTLEYRQEAGWWLGQCKETGAVAFVRNPGNNPRGIGVQHPAPTQRAGKPGPPAPLPATVGHHPPFP